MDFWHGYYHGYCMDTLTRASVDIRKKKLKRPTFSNEGENGPIPWGRKKALVHVLRQKKEYYL